MTLRLIALAMVSVTVAISVTTPTEWIRVVALLGVAFNAFYAGRTWEITARHVGGD